MITQQRSLLFLALLFDLIVITLTLLMAAYIAQPLIMLLARRHMMYLPIILYVVWYFSIGTIGFYEEIGSRFYASDALNLFKLVFAQSVTVVLFLFVVKEDLYTRNFFVAYTVLLYVNSVIKLIIFRKVLKKRKRSGKKLRNLLIIGSGETALDFLETAKQNPSLGYGYIGLVSDHNIDVPEYAGKLKDIESLILNQSIEETVISLDHNDQKILDKVLLICNKYALHTYIIPDYLKFLSAKFRISMVGKFPILTIRQEPLEELQWQLIKRAFDLGVSMFVIMLIVPWLFPILIILQKILSPGPVFYIQDRIGKSHSVFRCYKFRSMKYNKEDEYRPTEIHDERITGFGKFLRKSNFDELPQIFNVLMGNMSIVGPRPHAVMYDKVYKEFIEELRLRNLVKPGITGWAQIHGLRGDIPDFEENKKRIRKRIEYDVWYIENWSFGLDLQIILMTLWQMIKGDTKGS